MSHIFKVPIKKSKEQLLQDAATLLPQNGFTFVPDENGGRLSGHGFEGCIRFIGQKLEIEITKKPFIAPWSLVESKIRSFFAG